MAFALSTYQRTDPSTIGPSIVNFLKKQLKNGIKLRKAILEKGSIENKNILTECILECAELGLKEKTHIYDYCIYFVYKTVEALIKKDKCVLNRANGGYFGIYYDMVDLLFTLDELNLRGNRRRAPKEGEEVKQE